MLTPSYLFIISLYCTKFILFIIATLVKSQNKKFVMETMIYFAGLITFYYFIIFIELLN